MSSFNKPHFLNWLAVYPGGREAFAERIGYSLGTVNNWCSDRKIPSRVQKQISEMMTENQESSTTVVVPLSVAEYTRVEAASQADGYKTIESFARDALIEKAAEIQAGGKKPTTITHIHYGPAITSEDDIDLRVAEFKGTPKGQTGKQKRAM